jgi:hypothetical protein
VSVDTLRDYIAGVARAWEPYTTATGLVEDPLNADDTSDNYGVVMLGDVMLKVARETGDGVLAGDGVRIVESALALPVPNDPFNLLAIATVIHDGRDGKFPASAWEQIAGGLSLLAGRIGAPAGSNCLTEPGCYSNWRLVWAAGTALLTADAIPGEPGSLVGETAFATAQIKSDLALAVTHAGDPLLASVASGAPRERDGGARAGRGGLPRARGARGTRGAVGSGRARRQRRGGALSRSGLGQPARELSDPGAEPPAYELFSTFMLELIGESDASAVTPAVRKLRAEADRYALDMMAPDGQLSLAGRSLDQSWVQAAAAALGARRATLEPASAGVWRAFADRAASYLLDDYPLRPDGLLPIVPGLDLDWSPAIMDGYAALNQYEGLTLWLLYDALERWPPTDARRAALPADHKVLLADDLGSSGLVWGRSGGVWWELSGRASGEDPRDAQGLVAVKADRGNGWRDLLALRPIQHGASSAWVVGLARGGTATPVFEQARGTGADAVLSGGYRRPDGSVAARATWTLRTSAAGIRASMSLPAKATLRTTVWLEGASHLSSPGASRTDGTCVVTASGRACPVTISWRDAHVATLELEA